MPSQNNSNNQTQILDIKSRNLQERQAKTPFGAIIAMATMQQRPRSILNTAPDESSPIELIGQITLSDHYDPVTTSLRYARAGVDAVSFFTDSAPYLSDLDDMLMIAKALKNTPVIFQNYVLNEYHVIEARAFDASATIAYSSVLKPEEIRKIVSMTQRWKMTSLVQVGNEKEMKLANQLFPHVIAVGNHETQSVSEALQLLDQLKPLRQYNTRIMLMNCLTTFEEIEMALSHNIHALIISEDIIQNKEQTQRLHQLLKRKS